MVGSIPGSLAGSWTFGVRVNRAYRTNTHVHADLNNIMMLYTVYFFISPSVGALFCARKCNKQCITYRCTYKFRNCTKLTYTDNTNVSKYYKRHANTRLYSKCSINPYYKYVQVLCNGT